MNRVGRLSLRFDAVYCAVGAASLILFLGPISHRLSVAPAVTAVIAVGVGGWAIVLYRIARRRRIRRWLIGVLVANLAAATLIAAYAAVKPWDGAFTVLLVAVSVEIAAFAASQAFALRSSSLRSATSAE
jgi:hypothetical protein